MRASKNSAPLATRKPRSMIEEHHAQRQTSSRAFGQRARAVTPAAGWSISMVPTPTCRRRGQRGGTAEADHQWQHQPASAASGWNGTQIWPIASWRCGDLHARQVAQLDRLADHRERAGDHRLRGDHAAAVASTPPSDAPSPAPRGRTDWPPRAGRRAPARPGPGSSASARAAPPDQPPRIGLAAEVAHVGVQRRRRR